MIANIVVDDDNNASNDRSERELSGLRSSVMIRNIPNNYTRDMVLELFHRFGFKLAVDFLYLPLDHKSSANLGYAFVNIRPEYMQSFWSTFDGFSSWAMPRRTRRSHKVARIEWNAIQGLDALVTLYRNHSVMHPLVPEMRKPILLHNGVEVPFPEPCRALRQPRLRKHLFSCNSSC